MEREWRDELEVPGHVVAYEIQDRKSKKVMRDELRKILDAWERKGWFKLDDVPDSEPSKKRARVLLKSLGFDVRF